MHDVVVALVDPDGHRADTERERVRSERFWTHPPDVLSRSIDFLGDHPDDELLTAADGSVVSVTPASILEKGNSLSGKPVIMVARVLALTVVGGEDSSPIYALQLGGPTRRAVVYASSGRYGPSGEHTTGDTVRLRGVVTALGTRRGTDGLDHPTAYFTALQDYAVADPRPARLGFLRQLR